MRTFLLPDGRNLYAGNKEQGQRMETGPAQRKRRSQLIVYPGLRALYEGVRGNRKIANEAPHLYKTIYEMNTKYTS